MTIRYAYNKGIYENNIDVIDEESKLSIPLRDGDSKTLAEHERLIRMRAEHVHINWCEVGGRHLSMLKKYAPYLPSYLPSFPFYNYVGPMIYTGDLASFVIHNYCFWLRDEVSK